MKSIPRNDDHTMWDVELTHELILPCPFCGSNPKLEHTWTASYWIECEDCGASVGDPRISGDPENRRSHMASAKRALNAWNSRKL